VDTVVNAGAVVYGLILMLAAFATHPLTEALRLDALFLGQASEKTRPLNLVFGALVAGYGAWSLLTK